MYRSYSPLFTSGLLAEHSTAASSPIASSQNASIDDAASTVYFTLQTGKRDSLELRSFLSLDLADRRRRGHKRKLSILSKSTSWAHTVNVKPTHGFARTEKPMPLTSPVPVVPARRRTSKESLRSIPSPKPAPSITLPDPPITSDPRLPPPSTSPSSSSKKRPASTVVSSPLSPILRMRRLALLRSESISSHDRRKSRMDALACLEGRSRTPNRISRPTSLRNNFMNFSDDEGEKPMTRKSGVSSTAISPVIQDFADEDEDEDEVDVIVPTLARTRKPVDLVRPTMPGRKRQSTLESWFPLKSFIDFKDDDLSSWNWRSFIEIGGVS